jgi:hypothetical protein
MKEVYRRLKYNNLAKLENVLSIMREKSKVVITTLTFINIIKQGPKSLKNSK